MLGQQFIHFQSTLKVEIQHNVPKSQAYKSLRNNILDQWDFTVDGVTYSMMTQKWNPGYWQNYFSNYSLVRLLSNVRDFTLFRKSTYKWIMYVIVSWIGKSRLTCKKWHTSSLRILLSPQAYVFSIAFSLHRNLFCYRSLSLHFSQSYLGSLSLSLSLSSPVMCLFCPTPPFTLCLSHTHFLSLRQLFVGLNRT